MDGARGLGDSISSMVQASFRKAIDGNIALVAESLPPDHGGDSGAMDSSKKHAGRYGGTLGSVRKRPSSDL
ncbi:unnamed protein product, partial [Ilex paraguariensis]